MHDFESSQEERRLSKALNDLQQKYNALKQDYDNLEIDLYHAKGNLEIAKSHVTYGVQLIAEERREQIEVHGFDIYKDAEFYHDQELRRAAMWALTFDDSYYPSTWDTWFQNKMDDKRIRMSARDFDIERLKIAGALIAAEIDRIQGEIKTELI